MGSNDDRWKTRSLHYWETTGLNPSTVVAGVAGLGRWVVKELAPLCTITVTPLAKRQKNTVEDS
jgi:hypothetical protein